MSSVAWDHFNVATGLAQASKAKARTYLEEAYKDAKFELTELAELYIDSFIDEGDYSCALAEADRQLSRFNGSAGLQVLKVDALRHIDLNRCVFELSALCTSSQFDNLRKHDLGKILDHLSYFCLGNYTAGIINRHLLQASIAGFAERVFLLFDNKTIDELGVHNSVLIILRLSVHVFDSRSLSRIKREILGALLSRGIDRNSDYIGLLANSFSILSRTWRVGLLLSGQARGYSSHVEWINKSFHKYEFDLYISTWDKSGYRKPTIEKGTCHQLNRILESSAVDIFSRNPDMTAAFFAKETSISSFLAKPLNEQLIIERYGDTGAQNIAVAIEDENLFVQDYSALIDEMWLRHPIYTAHSTPANSLKMVYMNSRALRLIEDQDGYDIMIRLRLDGYLGQEERLLKAMESVFQGDHDLILDGAAMLGDQLAIGTPKALKLYCELWDRITSKSLDRCGGIGYGTQPHLRLNDYFIESLQPATRDPLMIVLHDDTIRISNRRLCSFLEAELCSDAHSKFVTEWLSNTLDEIKSFCDV